MFILSQDKTRIFNTSGHIEGIGYKEENFKEGKKEEIRHTIQVFGGCAEEIAEYKCKEDCLLVLYAIFNAIEQGGKTAELPTQEEMKEQREIRKELGEETAEDRQQDALDSFMARMMDKEDHTTEDYGWLEPDGTFHAVEWGNHQEWANDYLDKNLTQEERFAAMVEINASGMVKSSPDVIGAADYLVRRGWVLLHNPQQGIAIPTRDITREYTKAQKEFLYDYYMERDCKEEANAIWQDE